jgi:hypothetical protein
MKRKLADMFTVPPDSWNARGEPYFWEELRLHFLKSGELLPNYFDGFIAELHAAFENITKHSVNEQDWFLIEDYGHGACQVV